MKIEKLGTLAIFTIHKYSLFQSSHKLSLLSIRHCTFEMNTEKRSQVLNIYQKDFIYVLMLSIIYK